MNDVRKAVEVKKDILVDLEVEKRITAERDKNFINLVLDYAIEHKMSMEDIDGCMEKVSEVYYRDSLIKR